VLKTTTFLCVNITVAFNGLCRARSRSALTPQTVQLPHTKLIVRKLNQKIAPASLMTFLSHSLPPCIAKFLLLKKIPQNTVTGHLLRYTAVLVINTTSSLRSLSRRSDEDAGHYFLQPPQSTNPKKPSRFRLEPVPSRSKSHPKMIPLRLEDRGELSRQWKPYFSTPFL
jgi:hypothetical protein